MLLSAKNAPLAQFDVGDGEPSKPALRPFKRKVNDSGHLVVLRHKCHFDNSQMKRKRGAAADEDSSPAHSIISRQKCHQPSCNNQSKVVTVLDFFFSITTSIIFVLGSLH
jgi:ribosomal protein S21